MTIISYDAFKKQAPNIFAAFEAIKESNVKEYVKFQAALFNPCKNTITPEGEFAENKLYELATFLEKTAVLITQDKESLCTFNPSTNQIEFLNGNKEEVVNEQTKLLNKDFIENGLLEIIRLVGDAGSIMRSPLFSEAWEEAWNEMSMDLCGNSFYNEL